MKRPTAKDRVLAALRERPQTTATLCQPEIGGVRFSARLLELREDGHIIEDHPIRQGSWRYELIQEARTPLSIVPTPEQPAPVSSNGAWGEFKVCGRCCFVWHERGMATSCPSCKIGMQWTEDHWTHAEASRRAREIDPDAVERELVELEAQRQAQTTVAA